MDWDGYPLGMESFFGIGWGIWGGDERLDLAGSVRRSWSWGVHATLDPYLELGEMSLAVHTVKSWTKRSNIDHQ